jgi:hypothetical protein
MVLLNLAETPVVQETPQVPGQEILAVAVAVLEQETHLAEVLAGLEL